MSLIGFVQTGATEVIITQMNLWTQDQRLMDEAARSLLMDMFSILLS